ncbi:signal peptidase I [Leifsonia sp. YIM 134122]|uniref:Signal peptidase I n=1 Tax=Leifsonia stereocauli TaxID=3134136 RepID=A0ABU9W1T1_9MICO
MRALRTVGLVILYAFAGLGVLSGVAWAAHSAGLLHPLVVVSGSMSPGIRTGDLVVSIPKPIADVTEGDVITLSSPVTHRLVTHRVIAVRQDGADGYAVTLKGDANSSADNGEYLVAANASPPTPWFIVPGAGRAVETVSRPTVAIPLVIALAALVGLVALPSRRDAEEDQKQDDGPALTPAEPAAVGTTGSGGAPR